MTAPWIEWCILQGLCIAVIVTEVYSECSFPGYLQSPLNKNSEPMPWMTKVWWLNLRHAPKQKESQEIFVMREHIWSQRQNNRWPCEYVPRMTSSKSSPRTSRSRRLRHRATQYANCSEKYLEYNRTCLSEDRFNRFRVIQFGPGVTATFVCLKFVKRSDNVVQIYEGPTRTNNSADLCDDKKMELKEWPWIAPWKKEVSTCPISGGFSFRTVSRLTNEDFCEDEWRKSRLEIDCAKGDGLNFIAPKGSHCNPFSSNFEVSRFYCWAGWRHEHFTYLVIGQESGVPQYCLRFPREPKNDFSVTVYFSVVCPSDPDGRPERGIEYHEMKMTKLNSDNCTDDDHFRCQHVKRRGQCAKEEKYGVHCEYSCDRCAARQNLIESVCHFHYKLHGSWLFIDIFHEEKVVLNETTAVFPKFGTFHCNEISLKSKYYYKTVTTFTNGCAMRYTCFEFRKRNRNILQFRAGASFRNDVGFDEMCQFNEPVNPVEDAYRGSRMKNLILDGGKHLNDFCGFGHSIPFNGSIYGEHCSGHVSDWDSDGCLTTGTLHVKSDNCRHPDMPTEFQCLGFLNQTDNILETFLITKTKTKNKTRTRSEEYTYNCWVITASVCQSWDWKFRAMYRLQSPQCTTLSQSACIVDNSPKAFLYLHDEQKSKYCKPEFIPDVTFPFLGTTAPRIPEGQVPDPPYWTHEPPGRVSRGSAVSIRQHSCIIRISVLISTSLLVLPSVIAMTSSTT